MYCWEWVCETTDNEGNFGFDQGAKLILRIKVKEAWEAYIYMARSAYGGLGIFYCPCISSRRLVGTVHGTAGMASRFAWHGRSVWRVFGNPRGYKIIALFVFDPRQSWSHGGIQSRTYRTEK